MMMPTGTCCGLTYGLTGVIGGGISPEATLAATSSRKAALRACFSLCCSRRLRRRSLAEAAHASLRFSFLRADFESGADSGRPLPGVVPSGAVFCGVVFSCGVD